MSVHLATPERGRAVRAPGQLVPTEPPVIGLTRSLALTAMLFACTPAPGGDAAAVPAPNEVVTAITRLEQVEWARASKAKDTVWFHRHVAPDAVFTTGRTGAVTTRDTELIEILDPSLGGGEDEVSDFVVRAYGHVGVATFRLDATGVDRSGPYRRSARYTETWVFREGRWQLVASHSSLLLDSLHATR